MSRWLTVQRLDLDLPQIFPWEVRKLATGKTCITEVACAGPPPNLTNQARLLTHLHICEHRLFDAANAEEAEQAAAAFEAAYDLGAQLLRGAGGAARSLLDADLATGHLMRLAREHAGLARPPAATPDAGVSPFRDQQAPVLETMVRLACTCKDQSCSKVIPRVRRTALTCHDIATHAASCDCDSCEL